eukprot:GFUD01129061.1.p1 GENE.GFUD01129061.1~~GFUD01129061.1.p1  ORF type:complete len:506 (-),score=129.79 GFUD01129061.1:87-1520(-)
MERETEEMIKESEEPGEKVSVKSIEVAMILWSVTQEDEDFERVKKMIVKGKTELNERYPVKAHGKTLNLSPLHTAVYLQSPQLVELLMTSDGVDVGLEFINPEDSDDIGNVLDLAVSLEMSLDVIQSVLENDADRKLVTKKVITSLLCNARFISKAEVVELLLGYEAVHPVLNPLVFLAIAIKQDNLDMFTKILPRAKPILLNTIIPLPCCGCSLPTITLLHLAICMKNLKVVKLLLQAGSDVNSTEDLSEGQLGGSTPLMQAIVSARHRGYCSKENCQDRVISELLGSQDINLDIQVGEKTSKKTALDLVHHDTCPGIKKMIEQAYARHNLRKKLMKRKEDPVKSAPAKGDQDQAKGPPKSAQAKADTPISTKAKSPATSDQGKGPAQSDQVEAEADLVKGDQVELSKHGREKICWKCGSPPSFNKLYRCAGCKVAWYCRGACQGEDWGRHSGWCVLMERRRKERKEKKEKDCQEE